MSDIERLIFSALEAKMGNLENLSDFAALALQKEVSPGKLVEKFTKIKGWDTVLNGVAIAAQIATVIIEKQLPEFQEENAPDEMKALVDLTLGDTDISLIYASVHLATALSSARKWASKDQEPNDLNNIYLHTGKAATFIDSSQAHPELRMKAIKILSALT